MNKKYFNNDWDDILKNYFQRNDFINLIKFVKQEYKNKIIYPEKQNIFNAFKLTSYKDTKVVIIGQDPYHEKGQAMGLSFSVPKGIKIPASLNNIYKELNNDLGITPSKHGDLTSWAKQGVLLLNSTLTVEEGKANSHSDIGWQNFTDYIIKELNKKETPVVFILWGKNASLKKKYITNPKHLIIESAHPSPLSAHRGFFGSRPFSKVNDFLIKNNLKEIKWEIK